MGDDYDFFNPYMLPLALALTKITIFILHCIGQTPLFFNGKLCPVIQNLNFSCKMGIFFVHI